MPKFNVTYAIVTPESAEHGDFDETGFVCEDVSLREAWEEVGRSVTDDSGRWFTNSEYGHGTAEYYTEGREEERCLHPPPTVTPASYRRLRRLFNVR
jgi:hypothetical protein